MTNKKITKATFKSFVKNNFDKLHLSSQSSFDGRIDGLSYANDKSFKPVRQTEWSKTHSNNTLGIHGVWLVGSSRDYFTHYEDDNFVGIEVDNSCANFMVAIPRA